jgi:hypothetical protein
MKYIKTMRIPVKNPNRNMTTLSEECALKQLEDMKKQYNVIGSEWVDGDLVVKIEVDI